MTYATIAVLFIGLMLMGGLLWLRYTHWLGLAAAALVFSVISAYNGSLGAIQNAARQRAVVAFHGGLDGWLKILLVVAVMLWLGNSSTAVVIGYACSSLVVTGSQFTGSQTPVFCLPSLHKSATMPRSRYRAQCDLYPYFMIAMVNHLSSLRSRQSSANRRIGGGYAAKAGLHSLCRSTGTLALFQNQPA